MKLYEKIVIIVVIIIFSVPWILGAIKIVEWIISIL